jgi:hypothetical protein
MRSKRLQRGQSKAKTGVWLALAPPVVWAAPGAHFDGIIHQKNLPKAPEAPWDGGIATPPPIPIPAPLCTAYGGRTRRRRPGVYGISNKLSLRPATATVRRGGVRCDAVRGAALRAIQHGTAPITHDRRRARSAQRWVAVVPLMNSAFSE